MGEAKRRKLLDPSYGKTKVSFQQFALSCIRTFYREKGKKGVLNLFFKQEVQTFDVYPGSADLFLLALYELDDVFANSLLIEFQKTQKLNLVLPILITYGDQVTGVFFGFDTISGEIPNWLMGESFDFEFFKKIISSEFYAWLDYGKRQMYLKFAHD